MTKIFTDDPDRHKVFTVTDANGNDLTFTPNVAVADGDYDIVATWLGSAASTRDLSVPLTSISTPGVYALHLQVPNDNDIELGEARMYERH